MVSESNDWHLCLRKVLTCESVIINWMTCLLYRWDQLHVGEGAVFFRPLMSRVTVLPMNAQICCMDSIFFLHKIFPVKNQRYRFWFLSRVINWSMPLVCCQLVDWLLQKAYSPLSCFSFLSIISTSFCYAELALSGPLLHWNCWWSSGRAWFYIHSLTLF